MIHKCYCLINSKRSDRHVAQSNFSIFLTWKNIKRCIKINLGYQDKNGYQIIFLMDHILYQKIKIRVDELNFLHSISDTQDYFRYIIKKHERTSDNFQIQICMNKT